MVRWTRSARIARGKGMQAMQWAAVIFQNKWDERRGYFS
jgi:hypothetical protein